MPPVDYIRVYSDNKGELRAKFTNLDKLSAQDLIALYGWLKLHTKAIEKQHLK